MRILEKALQEVLYPASLYFPRAALKLWRMLSSQRAHFVFYGLPARLEPEHLCEPRLFAHREQLLESLPKHSVVAEIGTYRGEFARKILDTCAPAQLHVFDLSFALVKPATIDDDIVTRVQGNSSAELEKYPDGFFDWIYIDGDHSYSGVRRDSKVAVQKLKSGGLLVFNDYTIFDPLSFRPFGVIHAVNELCVRDRFKVAGLALHRAGFQDIALRKPHE